MEKKARKPATQRGLLSRAAIIEAAAAILTAEGSAGLTMRRVANALGVEAMSLYNHVRDKRDLLEGAAALKLSRLARPDPAAPWPDRLRTLVLSLYEILAADPWLVMVLTAEQIEPRTAEVFGALETAVAAFAEAGLKPPQQVSALRGLLALCFGLVTTHTIGLRMTSAEAEEHLISARLDVGSNTGVPHLLALAPQFIQTRPRDDLTFMVDAYIAALAGRTV
jgi:AcrR family transcriptional regulator